MAASAEAFQESSPPQVAVAQPAAPPSSESVLGLDEEDTSEGSPAARGAGSFNFGLELLYGGKTAIPSTPDPTDEDVGLKGRLKTVF
ncbi:MAG: hypothetical protein R3D57_11620 [Hyphomicrobiaceae bacterium]